MKLRVGLIHQGLPKKYFKGQSKKPGSVKNYSIHTIRHSFATHLLDNGTDLQAIQQLMGHQHIHQTVHYLHLSTKRLQNIVNPYDVLMHKDGL